MKIVQYCLFFIYYFTVAISRPSDENSDKLDETKSDLDINSDSNQNVTEKVSYSGAQVLNVYAENVKELLDDLIAKGDAEEWGGNKTHIDVFVPKDNVPKIKSYLAEKNINYKIMIENVQDAIDSENPPISDEEDEFEGRKGHKMTWRSYHRLSDIYGYLDYLAETYPDIVTVGSVGNSVEGRQIKYIRISSGKPNAKKFWLDGGIHAREWISPATVTYIISEFVENRNAHLPVVDGIDFYIVPVVNPDGYEYTHFGQRLWRKNRSKGNYFCPGTDLNRNWGYMWGGQGTSGDNCREIYRGTGPFSEPETRSVSNFVLNNKDNMKEIWKETEEQLVEKVRKLDQQLKLVTVKNSKDYEELHNKYRKAQETIKKLDSEIKIIKEEKSLIEKTNEELTVDVTRLNCEVEEYKKELQEWGKTEREKLAVLESNAVIQSKLSQANTEVTRKQTEIIRLNGEIGRLRGELEKIRLGSVVNHSTDNSCTITQLQAALAMERENCRDVSNERDSLIKDIAELKRQLKEMESIIIKRSKSGICFPPLNDYQLNSHSKNIPNDIISDKKNKDLERQMIESKSELNVTKQMLKEQQVKYENEIFELEQQIKKLQKENNSLKHMLEDQPSKSRRVTAAINSAKEDAHLLATIRGLKMELNAREKDIIRLNKELDDTKKTNKRLQKERERSLNPVNKLRASIPLSIGKDMEKSVSRPGSEVSVCSSKDYNPVLYEEDQETLIFLRTENRSLREEIKKLEQDLISLHNKRIQDLSDLQEQHEVEVARLVRDHAAKHASSTVAHLQSQLYTQQMVIHHLKDQIKELESRLQEVSMLKAERDHLETTLIEANKKIARLHDLASPESVQYSGLLEKLEFLERRHEVREQKLQSIVRDLIAKQGQGGTCSSNCRDKLLNKNREICYYRAEMDKILDTLSEFRWN